MTSREVLEEAAKAGLRIRVLNGDLSVRPRSLLTPELRAEMVANKPELVVMLSLAIGGPEGLKERIFGAISGDFQEPPDCPDHPGTPLFPVNESAGTWWCRRGRHLALLEECDTPRAS